MFRAMRRLPATGSGSGVTFSRRHKFSLLLLSLLLSRMAPAAASPGSIPDAFSLLAQAMRAKLHQTYTAHQETLFASGTSGAQWTRVVVDIARDGRRSCMTYRFPPSVADLIVADTGKVVRQFQPSCHLFLCRSSSPDGGETELSLLRRNYRCRWKDRVLLGGFLCDRISVVPRFAAGPWRVCWIDRVHKTVLRTEEYDAAGCRQYLSTLSRMRFASSLPRALFSPQPPPGTTVQTMSAAGNMSYARAWAASGQVGRFPCWLPRGWALLHCTPVTRPGGGQALRLRFGDGLKNLSVFEEAVSSTLPPLPIQEKMLHEQLGRYGQQAWVMEGGGIRVTVVGDATLPPEMGQELLRSLQPDTERSLARALARDFGLSAAQQGAAQRRKGWGYEQIAARLLLRRSPDQVQEKARNWVISTVMEQKK